MNETRDVEREVAAWVVAQRDSAAPARALDETLTATTDQRPLPRWLALIKEPPMRLSSRVAVGSPATRLAAIAIGTILITTLGAGAVVAGASYLAASSPLIVDPGDATAYPTIGAAVDAAKDGDTVLIRPGLYPESVTITEDIVLRGETDDGSLVVIGIAPDGPTYDPDSDGGSRYGLLLGSSDAEVSDLTVRDLDPDPGWATAVVIAGGAPSVHDIRVEGADAAVYLVDGTTATVADSVLEGDVILWESGAATITGNTIHWQVIVQNAPDAAPVLVSGNEVAGITVAPTDEGWIGSAGRARVAANVLRLPPGETDSSNSELFGINVISGTEQVVEGNDVAGFDIGIEVKIRASGTVDGNVLSDNRVGIVSRGSTTDETRITHNVARGGDAGIQVGLGSQMVEANDVSGAEVGLEVFTDATPTIVGNTLCGNGVNLVLADGAQPDLRANEICADGLATTG